MAGEILASDDPRHQKALGRKVRQFDEKVWGANCKDIVKRGNMAKVITLWAVMFLHMDGYSPTHLSFYITKELSICMEILYLAIVLSSGSLCICASNDL